MAFEHAPEGLGVSHVSLAASLNDKGSSLSRADRAARLLARITAYALRSTRRQAPAWTVSSAGCRIATCARTRSFSRRTVPLGMPKPLRRSYSGSISLGSLWMPRRCRL